jgi:hypothetical protein
MGLGDAQLLRRTVNSYPEPLCIVVYAKLETYLAILDQVFQVYLGTGYQSPASRYRQRNITREYLVEEVSVQA